MEIIIVMFKELMDIYIVAFSELTRRTPPLSVLESALLRTAAFIFLLVSLLVSTLLIQLSFSGWSLLFMKLLLSTDPDYFAGVLSDLVPVLSDMTYFKVAVPLSCVVLFLLVLQSAGFSVTRFVANWGSRARSARSERSDR